ncbi:hypothetical protein GIB67_031719 [Kingdonia uniflora]|uniref:K Homology domain-containing protein n=1 Tax=Kingdonia uniflora TaxID=39325 RepID=A0A7J7NKS4_9MAGN|nr:hypothetical protein GIB67_031719 [Kingdonia uniflora]
MAGSGKRSRNQKDHVDDEKHQKSRRAANDREENPVGDDELIVYRILCPDGVIGSVIGKSGKVINSIRQETRARIKVVDPFPGAKERIITIYCYVKEKKNVDDDGGYDDNDMDPLCPAQDALLKVHSAIVHALAVVNRDESERKGKEKEEAHILVPTSQAANIIGKSGATIKKLRNRTRTSIKVSAKDISDPTHSCAMDYDNFILITGDAEAVKKALYEVSTIMYKFSPKEAISLDSNSAEAPPSIIIPSDVPLYPASGFYAGANSIVPPSRSVIGSTAHVPEFEGYMDKGSTWPMYSSGLPIISGYGAPSRSEELVLRMLCPSNKIGRVIGKGGVVIKSVRQESGAVIEVDDTKDRRDECVITITSTESMEDLKSMTIEAVLLLQEKINGDDDDTVTIRLLVPSKVIGCLIGKSGSIVNEIRKITRCDVRISKSEKPKLAKDNDELVEVTGKVGNVREALVQIVLRLRDDALRNRDGGRNPPADSMYSGGGGHSLHSVLPNIPAIAPLGYDERSELGGGGLGMHSSSSHYGYGSFPVYSFCKPLYFFVLAFSKVGDNAYGSMSSYSPRHYSGLQPPATLEMLIPSNAVGKVLGKSGSNLANIRKISGAIVEVVESRSSRGDRVAQISGTSEQKRTAENLIQAFIMAT